MLVEIAESVGLAESCRLLFARLTEEQRRGIAGSYCRHCFTDNPRCQCWNDE